MRGADRRLFLVIRNVNYDREDQDIIDATIRLQNKARNLNPVTKVVTYSVNNAECEKGQCFDGWSIGASEQDALRDELAWLQSGQRPELIIRGHGTRATQDVPSSSLAGVKPHVLAQGLVDFGLYTNCRINITGCNLGRGPAFAAGKTGDEFATALDQAFAADVGTGSFAAKFQIALFNTEINGVRGLENEIHARTLAVWIWHDGTKRTTASHQMGTRDENDTKNTTLVSRQKNSKIIFRIKNDANRDGYAQTMTFAYSDTTGKIRSYENETYEDMCGIM